MTSQASNAAVSGMNAFNSALSGSAKNISNSETVGYKACQTHFISQVTGQSASMRSFAAGGVSSMVEQLNDAQGLLEATTSSTDVSILGNGFMVVSSTSEGTPSIAYTRAGSYSKDNNGFLVNKGGFYAMGWAVDQKGDVGPNVNTSDLGSLERINVSNVSGFVKKTTSLDIAANLPSDNTLAPIGSKFHTDAKIFDSLGEGYTLSITWEKTAVGQYSASISCPAAANILKGSSTGANFTTNPMVVQFNSLGQPISYDGASTPPNIYIDWDPAQTNAAPSDITFNLGKTGTLEGIKSQAGTFNVSRNINDGEQYGNFNGVKIDENGIVSAFFDNGTNVPIYRLAMANFASPNQLDEESGNAFRENDQSGKCVLSFAKTAGFGKFASNSLENSTVDLPKELTSLIAIQRGYSANTHVIQTDSDMYKTLLQVHG